VVLLVSAGMLGQTMLRLASTNPGFDIHNLLTARTAISETTLANPQLTRAAWQEVLDRVRAIPGVRSATVVDTVPLREGNNEVGYGTSPNLPPDNQRPVTLATCVSSDYFQTMGIPLLEGRLFDDHDRAGSESVVVIDDVMAEKAFHGKD